jgi:hypothetical protein
VVRKHETVSYLGTKNLLLIGYLDLSAGNV